MNLSEKGYSLVFEEDFKNGLEKNNWQAKNEELKSHPSSDKDELIPSHVVTAESIKHSGSVMRYSPENVYTENGELVIKAGKNKEGFFGGQVVCEGVVFTRGYIEYEVKLPKFQKGVWLRARLISTKGNKFDTAFDIVAVHGDKGKNASSMYMGWTDPIYEEYGMHNLLAGAKDRLYPNEASSDEILSDGYHIFGLEYTEDKVVFSFDGIEYDIVNINSSPYYPFKEKNIYKFLFELSIGLPLIPAPEENADFPTEFRIKRVSLYHKDDGIIVRR